MKYFIDTEFKEYFKQHKLFGIPIGYPTPTIDLVSIAIVCENGNSFYALNKDCDLAEIWKDEWLRENVLLAIYKSEISDDQKNYVDFTYVNVKWIFNHYGVARNELAYLISNFVYRNNDSIRPGTWTNDGIIKKIPIEFYGYYSDYDWVVFCQLFGRMMDLPKEFPMYCKDLKQMYDEKALSLSGMELTKLVYPSCNRNVYEYLENTDPCYQIKALENSRDYPKQDNEHNALSDAKWNFKLYQFIQSII